MQKESPGQEIQEIRAEGELLYSPAEVNTAIDSMAAAITEKLSDKNPLLICLVIGGIVPAGMLIPKLDFPLEVDYLHATRYRGEISGREIQWLKKPGDGMENRHVLLIDDILDEGITLASMIEECKKRNVASVSTAVLVDKQLQRERALANADFTGLPVPDRYVFGYGMDYKGYLRNAPGIFAVKNP